MNQDLPELAALLNLPAAAGDEEIRSAFHDELKRLHPDTGGRRTPSDITRLETLLAAHDRWERDASRREPVPEPVVGARWVTDVPRGPEPRPGFWQRPPKPPR